MSPYDVIGWALAFLVVLFVLGVVLVIAEVLHDAHKAARRNGRN